MIDPLRYRSVKDQLEFEVHHSPIQCWQCLQDRVSTPAFFFCHECGKVDSARPFCRECFFDHHMMRKRGKEGRKPHPIVRGNPVVVQTLDDGDGRTFAKLHDWVTLDYTLTTNESEEILEDTYSSRQPLIFQSGCSGPCIHLQLLGCTNIAAADVLGFSDPYCAVYWKNNLVGVTTTKHMTLNPTWVNQTFVLPLAEDFMAALNDEESSELFNAGALLPRLRIELYDWDRLSKNDFLGQALVSDASILHSLRRVRAGEIDENSPISVDLMPKQSRGKLGIRVGLRGRKLFVHVMQAENVPKADPYSLSDPYCEVYWNETKVGKTAHMIDTLDPVWDLEIFVIKVDDEGPNSVEQSTLRIQCLDWDRFGSDDILGQIELQGWQIKELAECGMDDEIMSSAADGAREAAGMEKIYDFIQNFQDRDNEEERNRVPMIVGVPQDPNIQIAFEENSTAQAAEDMKIAPEETATTAPEPRVAKKKRSRKTKRDDQEGETARVEENVCASEEEVDTEIQSRLPVQRDKKLLSGHTEARETNAGAVESDEIQRSPGDKGTNGAINEEPGSRDGTIEEVRSGPSARLGSEMKGDGPESAEVEDEPAHERKEDRKMSLPEIPAVEQVDGARMMSSGRTGNDTLRTLDGGEECSIAQVPGDQGATTADDPQLSPARFETQAPEGSGRNPVSDEALPGPSFKSAEVMTPALKTEAGQSTRDKKQEAARSSISKNDVEEPTSELKKALPDNVKRAKLRKRGRQSVVVRYRDASVQRFEEDRGILVRYVDNDRSAWIATKFIPRLEIREDAVVARTFRQRVREKRKALLGLHKRVLNVKRGLKVLLHKAMTGSKMQWYQLELTDEQRGANFVRGSVSIRFLYHTRGTVLRGVDVGVSHMSLGERARINVRSDYGFGEVYAARKVPPYTGLVFVAEVKAIGDHSAGWVIRRRAMRIAVEDILFRVRSFASKLLSSRASQLLRKLLSLRMFPRAKISRAKNENRGNEEVQETTLAEGTLLTETEVIDAGGDRMEARVITTGECEREIVPQ